MRFLEIVEYFDKIEQTSSRIEMTELLAEMFKKAEAEELKKLVYLCQGQLGPQYSAPDLGLGENFVIDSIAKTTGYSEKKIKNSYQKKGDLGLVAMDLVKTKAQKSLFKQKLDLEKVFSNLEKIAKAEGTGSQELKKKLLAELLNSAEPLEAKFIIRLSLESLRLGVGDPTIMDGLSENHVKEFEEMEKNTVKKLSKEYSGEELHRQIRARVREKIEEKYNVHSDLGQIATLLEEKGLKGLKKIQIQVGIPIRPTLAERLPSAEEIIEKIGRCAVEAKLDGFRMQVHKNNEKVTLFSRRQEDMTHMFPEIVKAVREQVKPKKAILEGEALAYSEETDEFYSFQVTIQRKRKYGVKEYSEKFPLQLFLFDAMYADGENLMDLPFKKRRKKLKQMVSQGKDIKLTDQIITSKPKELNEFFDLNVQKGLEGIIAKDLNAKYIAGARKYAWIKLKRSYKGDLGDTIDTVIIGYYAGKGARAKFGLGALLVAVYNEEKDCFETIAKIGTGMTEKQLTELEKMLKKERVKKKPARAKSELEPDYWVEPKQVIEVRADEITESPVHTAAKQKGKEGLALRFPRMVKLRTDKEPEQSTTVKEIKKMFKQQGRVESE